MTALHGWQRAVLEALELRRAAQLPLTRRSLITPPLLQQIVVRAGARAGKHPEQSISLALQRLRARGVVEFVRPGHYRLKLGGLMPATASRPGLPPVEERAPARPATGDARERKRERLRELGEKKKSERQLQLQQLLAASRAQAGNAEDHMEPRFIPMGKLRRGEINRDPIKKLYWDIALSLRWRSFQGLSVDDMGDDTFKIREGHNRYEALLLLFPDEPERLIPCYVTRYEGEVQAAVSVGDINITRRSWTGYGKFWLKWHQEDETARALMGAMEALDLTAPKSVGAGMAPGDVSGVVVAYECAGRSGVGIVARALALIQRAYGDDPVAFRAGHVGGMWDFLLRYALADPFREDFLVAALRGTTIAAIYESAGRKFANARTLAVAEEKPNPVDEHTAHAWAIYDAYGAYTEGDGRRRSLRLPEFDLPITAVSRNRARARRIATYAQWERKEAR